MQIYSYLDKMKKDMPNKISPMNDVIAASSSKISIQQINNLLRPSSSTSTNKSNKSSHFDNDSIVPGGSAKEVRDANSIR